MTNNDVLRRLRYCFDISDRQMMKAFQVAGLSVTREEVSAWLKADDHDGYRSCPDKSLAIFLNGFITQKRGAREGKPPVPEETLTNNIVLRKLKIALDLRSDEILAVMSRAGFSLSEHELSAFFRKPGHKHYRTCKDQVLRNFLKGLQYQKRGSAWDAAVKDSEQSDNE